MRKSVRVTELGNFMRCPFKMKYDTSEWDPLNTYHGDLLNVGLTSVGDFDMYWEWYSKHFIGDIKLKESGLMNTYHISLFKESLRCFFDNVYHEAKVHYPRGDDYLITGTPDVVVVPTAMSEPQYEWSKEFYQENGGIDIGSIEDLGDYVFVFDGKHSKHSMYFPKDEDAYMEIWKYSMQPYAYPLFIMEMLKLVGQERKKGIFTYLVYDKVTSKYRYESMLVTYDMCKKILDNTMQRFIEADLLQEYPANQNKQCRFCPLKSKCPARGNSSKQVTEQFF